MYRYMRTKFQFSSVILGVLDRGGSFTPPPSSKTPLKTSPILGLKTICCSYCEIPELEASISPLNFNEKLPDLLFTCLCPTFVVNGLTLFLFCCVWSLRVVAVAEFQRARGLLHYLILWLTPSVSHMSLPYFFGEWPWDWTKEFVGNGIYNRKLNNIYTGLSPKAYE